MLLILLLCVVGTEQWFKRTFFLDKCLYASWQ